MTTRHPLLAAVLAGGLLLAACGDDDDTTSGSASASASASASGTADEATDDTTEAGGEADADAATDAVATVFDSAVPFDEKVGMIEGGEVHRVDHEAYVAGSEAVGGIVVEPTDVAVNGAAATVTYRVLFAGTEAYADLTMDVALVDGAWVVPTDTFCGFLASARTPCAAGAG